MMTLQITLPDRLARDTQAAGLLQPERLEAIFREQLRLRAADTLKAMWRRAPEEALTPDTEQAIDDEVQAYRKDKRATGLQ
jgi:ASC-1-like (ASCH) protein